MPALSLMSSSMVFNPGSISGAGFFTYTSRGNP